MVKEVLRFECNEARAALKPWSMETIVKRKVDANSCICHTATSSTETQDEEIADEIDRALLQVQELRKKSNAAISDKKRIRSIGTEVRADTFHKTISKRTDHDEVDSVKRHSLQKQGEQRVERESINKKRHEKNFTARNNDKIEHQVKNPKLTIKKKPPTNFILANKLSVKNASLLQKKNIEKNKKMVKEKIKSCSNIMSPKQHSTDVKKKSRSLSTDNSNALELDKLIKKLSIASTSSLNSKVKDCPYHGSPSYVEERIIKQVDAAEGLATNGIPSNMLKILKIHHSYLKLLLSADKQYVKKRREEAVNSFLSYFQTMNDNEQKMIPPELRKFTTDFMKLFTESFDENMDFVKKSQLKVKYTNLDMQCKDSQWKFNYGITKLGNTIFNEPQPPFTSNGWLSNGIWNDLCIKNFKDMSRASIIRYTDKKQLLSFFDVTQQLQRLEYEQNLIDIISRTLIPEVKKYLCPTSEEYVEIYKMIVTIIQILNPKFPVLTRTDV